MEQPEVDFKEVMCWPSDIEPDPNRSGPIERHIKSMLISLADGFGSVKITGVPPR